MEEGMQTSVVNHAESSDGDDVLIDVGFKPVMQVAVGLLESFSKEKRLVLKAVGNAIPNAVAVANILTESMLKDEAHAEDITVDSVAPPGIGSMTSTIKIVLTRRA